MNDRFKFRAGFTISFYDITGNDVERQIILDSCFSIDNGGEGICVNETIIQEALDIYVAKDGQKSAWDFINANYAETDGYYFIDSVDFLEQCTGLRDKNDRLIYEGDILNSLYRSDGCKGLYRIVWCEGRLLPEKFGNHQQKQVTVHLTDLKRCEIIGNIHETPELLKGVTL